MSEVDNDSKSNEHLGQTDAPPCWQQLTFVGAFALFGFSRLLNWLWRPAPVVGGDTPMYIPTSEQGRFGLVDFLGNRSRPGVITALFAVLESPDRIVLAQHFVSGVLWGLLLVLVAVVVPLPRSARAIGTLLIACIASLPAVALWNDVLMSESFSLSWVAALSAGAIVLWARSNRLSPLALFAVSAWFAIFTALLGPVRPLSLGLTAVSLIWLAIVAVRKVQPVKRASPADGWRSVGQIVPALAGLLLVVASGLYVVVVDARANDAWGREFAGLEDFNGRAIQQLTVVNQSSEWSMDAYWYYIRSIGDQCVEAGFSSGQYWPATAMQCPEGIRELADTFQSHYLTDYLRSLPKHLDESIRDYRIGWSYLSHPPGHGVDMLPGWSREILLNQAPDDSWSPLVYPILLMILLSGVGALVVVDRFRSRSGRESVKTLTPSLVLLPSSLFFASLAAVLLTVIVSPGDPRVAVVHATSGRIWLVLSMAAVVSHLASRPELEGLRAGLRLPQEAGGRDE